MASIPNSGGGAPMPDGFGASPLSRNDGITPLPKSCDLCPRRCGADRAVGQRGRCGADDKLLVARAALHFWEEPPISGTSGSGTVFFSNCALRCVFCQNQEISRGQAGKAITVTRLAQIFLELQDKGARNINLVTPTQYRMQIADAIPMARADGLSIPIVYNTGGYETVESIRALDGLVDIYLTDMKYVSPELSARYSDAPDYFEAAAPALDAMVEQVGTYKLSGSDDDIERWEEGEGEYPALSRGVIVRHLMLPGQLADSKAVVRHVFSRYGNDVCLSLMNQYTPFGDIADFPELSHTVDEDEYSQLVDYALSLGVENSFMQEGGTQEESFIPPFDCEGV